MTRFRATSTRFLSEKQRTEKTLRPTTPMSSFISISFFSIVELPTNCNLPNERRSGSRSVTDSDVNRESFSLSTDAQHPLRFLIPPVTHYQSLFLRIRWQRWLCETSDERVADPSNFPSVSIHRSIFFLRTLSAFHPLYARIADYAAISSVTRFLPRLDPGLIKFFALCKQRKVDRSTLHGASFSFCQTRG